MGQGTLYLVGTPIGNLEDMTLRAVRILQGVDLIAAEDTRHTGKLLQHFQIKTPTLSYHQHNRSSRETDLLEKLQQGKSIALVTDAGMPGISDPGYELVRACHERQILVIPIPGVTAAITALAVSGLSTERFCFEGFLPTKATERQERLDRLKLEDRTLIFYEAPHRLDATLQDFKMYFGDRRIVLARELTKLHEEIWRGTIEDAIALHTPSNQPRGEYTLVVAGASLTDTPDLSESQLKVELQKLMAQGMTRSQASRQLAQSSRLSRRQLYQLALEIESE